MRLQPIPFWGLHLPPSVLSEKSHKTRFDFYDVYLTNWLEKEFNRRELI